MMQKILENFIKSYQFDINYDTFMVKISTK